MRSASNTRLLPASPVNEKSPLLLTAPGCTAITIAAPQFPATLPAAARAPVWLLTLLSAAIVVLCCLLWIQHFAVAPDSKSGSPAQSPEAARAKPSPVESLLVDQTAYPLAQFVEVTGLRVVVDLNRRSQLQYLVVNHSSTPLSDIGLKVAVRSAVAAAGSDVLFRVAARVPSLGPNESKEIRTDLDSQLRASAIPDWGNLRADVQVVSQQ